MSSVALYGPPASAAGEGVMVIGAASIAMAPVLLSTTTTWTVPVTDPVMFEVSMMPPGPTVTGRIKPLPRGKGVEPGSSRLQMYVQLPEGQVLPVLLSTSVAPCVG